MKHSIKQLYMVVACTIIASCGDIKDDVQSVCGLADGMYNADVDYDNAVTGYSIPYTLSVEVENCQVVQINFPKDDHLNETHIEAADIDGDGNATVEDDKGRTYGVRIEN